MKILNGRKLCIIATIAVALVLRAGAVVFLDIEPGSDSRSYMEMATTMLATGHMDDGQGNLAFYSSGYPLFLIPFYAVFDAGPETARMLNLALACASVLLIYLCALAVLPSWRWALVPALVWATYPPAVLLAEQVFKENLSIPLLLLQTLLLLKYADARRKPLVALAIGALFGVELLVGPAVILTGALIALVVMGIESRAWRPRHMNPWPAVACCMGCAIVLAPWLSYTTAKLGTPILNTNGSFNLYLGNNANSTGMYIGIERTPIGPRWSSIKKEKGEVEAFAMLKDLALQHILDNPAATIGLSLTKLAYFWTPPVHAGKFGNQSRLETLMRLAWLVYYVLIVAFALVPMVRFRSLDRRHLLIYGTVVLYCAIHAVAYVLYRYRVPAMPLMSILAAVGLHYAYVSWENFWSQQRKAVDNP